MLRQTTIIRLPLNHAMYDKYEPVTPEREYIFHGKEKQCIWDSTKFGTGVSVSFIFSSLLSNGPMVNVFQ
jgi:hypothetical protein